MSNIIYEPKGRAREYSPLALNHYKGCDHGCDTCYIVGMGFDNKTAEPRNISQVNFIRELKTCKYDKQVLLSFIGDPYCNAEIEHRLTRQMLLLLLEYHVPVAILTKGGDRCLMDLDLFKQFGPNIKVGASLTYWTEEETAEHEPGAAMPLDRMDTLTHLSEEGITTWVSLEPLYNVNYAYSFIDMLHGVVDEWKIGKLNHYKTKTEIDYTRYCQNIKNMLAGKNYYVKKDLRDAARKILWTPYEEDYDRLTLKGWE